MHLRDLAARAAPIPWREGDNIPWNEPGFSRRMLQEHLSQAHDAASRRYATIDRHVQFIHQRILGGRPSRVLDLGCGPGLYASRLARLGHQVLGVDFSPASIDYARGMADTAGLDCSYTLADLRIANFAPQAFDLVMLIYGEFNVFNPADAGTILEHAWTALKPGGLLLLEVSTAESIRAMGAQPARWSAAAHGLFSDQPHLLLQESVWEDASSTATRRYFLVDAASGDVTQYASTYQAYTPETLTALLESAGFWGACFYPALTGDIQPGDFFAVTAARFGAQ